MDMTKTASLVSVLFLLLLVFSSFGSAFAQIQGLAGVAVGETFTYKNTYTWNSTAPGDFPPQYLSALNQSQLKMTIQTASGSTVQHDDVWTYQNGTVTAPELVTDELNSHLTESTIFLYAANLTAGGFLFPGATDYPFIINDTTFRSYPGSFRETNHIEVNNTSLEGMIYSYMNLYFDKATGVLVEYYLTSVYTSTPNQAITQHLVLTNSTVWQVSETSSGTPTSNPSSTNSNPTPANTDNSSQGGQSSGFPTSLIIIIVVVIVVVIVAGFVLLPKSKSKSKQESAPQDKPKESPQPPSKAPEEGSYDI
jgi:hypothetical protein